MSLTSFQREICRLLASHRTPEAHSYVAGGVALNAILEAPRLSRDVDVFHDTNEALEATWRADKAVLEQNNFALEAVRERAGFVEVVVQKNGESVEMQWLRDSAFRFFPLAPHPDLGLTLHPFDLATNKVLALVGRVEVRDWIDALTCHEKVAPLGLLAWAACGKDEGWNPQLIVDEANRTAHYSRDEILELSWDDKPPDFALLKTQWRQAVSEARQIIETLPPEEVGKAVVDEQGVPFRGSLQQLKTAFQNGNLQFHAGYTGGAWPQMRSRKSSSEH